MVEYHAASDPAFDTQVVAGDVFSTTLDGLKPFTEYEVRVRGKNAVGRSDPSVTKQSRTKVDGELNSQMVVEELLMTLLSLVIYCICWNVI